MQVRIRFVGEFGEVLATSDGIFVCRKLPVWRGASRRAL